MLFGSQQKLKLLSLQIVFAVAENAVQVLVALVAVGVVAVGAIEHKNRNQSLKNQLFG